MSVYNCQKLECCRVQVTLNPNWSRPKSTHLPWQMENSANKPLFSVPMDG